MVIDGPVPPMEPSPHPHLRFRFALPPWLGGKPQGPKGPPPQKPKKPKNTKPKGKGNGFSKSL